jgi:hypothetical protein
MTYADAMQELSAAAHAATKAAANEDGAPYHALRHITGDIDSLIDHGATVKEFASQRALYEGAKRAGLTPSAETGEA